MRAKIINLLIEKSVLIMLHRKKKVVKIIKKDVFALKDVKLKNL